MMLDFLVVCIHEKENQQNSMHESKYINKYKFKNWIKMSDKRQTVFIK